MRMMGFLHAAFYRILLALLSLSGNISGGGRRIEVKETSESIII